MGASAGGVSVKVDSSKYDLKQIVNDLIGSDFVQTDNYLDTRHPNNYYIVKTKDVITIYNSQFVEKFFKNQNNSEIQYIIDYFKTPELIFAHERYDSGGTYSYSLLYNGHLKRQFRSVSYETTINFGELEEVEIGWKNGEIIKNELDEDEFETTIINHETGQECEEDNLPQIILDQLQFDKLDFDDDDSKIIEKAFFVKQDIPVNQTNETKIEIKVENKVESKKSWWQIWK